MYDWDQRPSDDLDGPPPPAPRPRQDTQVHAPRRAARIIVTLGAVACVALVGGIAGALATVQLLRPVPGAPVMSAGSGPVAQLLSATTEPGAPDDIVAVVRATRPAVVAVLNLRHVRRSLHATELVPVGSGSGVVFDARGYVATNSHVIQGNQGIEVVFLDGSRARAEVVGQDASNFDVAILRVEGPVPAVAPLADSSLLEPGMRVVAIGSPLGTDYLNTVTTGIVAGLNRSITVSETSFDRRTWQFVQRERSLNAAPLIQTDAAINRGNSGGPLIDMNGRVVGLNTLMVRGGAASSVEGLGLAVPSNVVRALADEWIDARPRPDLGITFVAVTPDAMREYALPQAGGALIVEVHAGTVAESIGLRTGDVIVALDDVQLNLDRSLTEQLWRYRAGDEVRLTIRRGTAEFDSVVALGALAGAPQ